MQKDTWHNYYDTQGSSAELPIPLRIPPMDFRPLAVLISRLHFQPLGNLCGAIQEYPIAPYAGLACGRALRTGEPVIIVDVPGDAQYRLKVF